MQFSAFEMNMPLKDALYNLVHEINRKAMHFSVK